MSDTSLVELRVDTERTPDSTTEPIQQATGEDLSGRRRRFELALYEATEVLTEATQSAGESHDSTAQTFRVSWAENLVMRLHSSTEARAALFEQVLSDMLQDFGFVCRFGWTDVKDAPLRPSLEPLLSAWADLAFYVGSGDNRYLVIAEVKGAHTQLRTALDSESWSRGVQAIRRHRWVVKSVGDRKRSLYTTAGSSVNDPPRKSAAQLETWARGLATAADNGDEIAFEQERLKIDWGARSSEDFAIATRLALRAGAHLAAREFAIAGLERFPNHRELRNLVEVLSPPHIASQSNPSHDSTLSANMKWLRQDGPAYRGRWVALRAGQLVASADSAEALREKIAPVNGANRNDLVLTRVA